MIDNRPRLKKKYIKEIIPNLKGSYKSVMQVPRLVKIIINQGVGKGSSDKKLIDFAQKEISLISGQKAVVTRSRKDISNFKLRKGMPVGVKVTFLSLSLRFNVFLLNSLFQRIPNPLDFLDRMNSEIVMFIDLR